MMEAHAAFAKKTKMLKSIFFSLSTSSVDKLIDKSKQIIIIPYIHRRAKKKKKREMLVELERISNLIDLNANESDIH